IIPIPDYSPGDAQDAEEEKGSAPSARGDNGGHEHGSYGAAQPRAGMGNALGKSSLARQHPARQRSRGNGKCTRLSQTAQKPHDSHGGGAPGQSGGRDESGPPANDEGEGAARADAVTEPAAGNLK